MKTQFTAIMFVLLTACNFSANENNGNKDDADKDQVIVNVETSKAYSGKSIATFKSTAVLEADRAATVTTKSAGVILDILVEEGELVTKDQVLLVLESDEQQLSLKSAAANYEKSLNNFQRAEQLVAKGLVNKEQLDNLKFDTKALKAILDQAEMNLSFTQVKAPFSGIITRRHVKIGNLIQNATAVFEVIDFNSLQAKIDVPEHQLGIMNSGLQVNFKFDALAGMTVNGQVIRVSPVIDSATGTFQVTVSVDNSDNMLIPGLFAMAEIVFDQRNDVVLVDKDAIIREDELSYVYVLQDSTEVIKVAVTLGYEMLDSYEIVSGLMVGQEVVTTGKNNLTPDVKVNVVNYDESI